MKPNPKNPSLKKVAKSYRKNVKTKVKNLGTKTVEGVKGANPKVDKMMTMSMGENYSKMKQGSSFRYTGPLREVTRSIKKKAKAKDITYGGAKRTAPGKVINQTKTVKGKSL